MLQILMNTSMESLQNVNTRQLNYEKLEEKDFDETGGGGTDKGNPGGCVVTEIMEEMIS